MVKFLPYFMEAVLPRESEVALRVETEDEPSCTRKDHLQVIGAPIDVTGVIAAPRLDFDQRPLCGAQERSLPRVFEIRCETLCMLPRSCVAALRKLLVLESVYLGTDEERKATEPQARYSAMHLPSCPEVNRHPLDEILAEDFPQVAQGYEIAWLHASKADTAPCAQRVNAQFEGVVAHPCPDEYGGRPTISSQEAEEFPQVVRIANDVDSAQVELWSQHPHCLDDGRGWVQRQTPVVLVHDDVLVVGPELADVTVTTPICSQ
mmetsp:Transcript_115802/g.327571  ORF Transcript_115802/g.327571 Transcript_115802/m.327571 type:complete len:263 (-) Transcript_115802:614-1402(-)